MWKKRLLWRNELAVFNNNVGHDTDTKNDRDDCHSSSSSRDLLDINTERVSVRNGGFVPDTEGSLVISYHYVPLHNNNNNYIPDDQIQEDSLQMPGLRIKENMKEEETVPDLEQEEPMDLSLVKVEMKEEAMTSRDHDSGYTPSPPLVVDLTATPDEDYNGKQAVSRKHHMRNERLFFTRKIRRREKLTLTENLSVSFKLIRVCIIQEVQ